MKNRLLFIAFFAAIFTVNAQKKNLDSLSEEKLQEIVITATKILTNKKNLGKVVYQITPEIIIRNQGKSLVDLLNDVPGIEMNGNYSAAGQNLGYYIRGGRNKQVTVLIDGIVINDPSSFNNDFDLRQIPLDQIEKVEIVKGAASTLYGTGAATGVINIILKKASKKNFGGTFITNFGTNSSQEDQSGNIETLNTSINFNGTISKFSYVISANALQSKGLSAAESSNGDDLFKEDPFIRYNSLMKLGYQATDNVNISVFGSYDEFTSHYDGFDFMTSTYVDADNVLKSIQKRIGISPSYTYQKGELKLNAFYTVVDRNVNPPTNDVYKGEDLGFDIYNNFKFSDKFNVLTGLASQFQDMYQKTLFASIEEGSAKQHFFDPYFSLNFITGNGFNLNTGVRLNIHNEYGNHFVYNINPSFNFKINKKSTLKILSSYSTAFITPTLQEIFNKLPSNGKLNPEKDKTIEGGFELQLSKKLAFNTVYFYREEKDKIGYDLNTFQTINDKGTFIARGLETELMYMPWKNFQANANYAFVNREESQLLKIPKHKVNVNLTYKLRERTQFSLNGKFVDVTSDFGGIVLPSYRILDIFMNHKLIDNRLTIFASVTNLLNEDFQEIAGFSTRGRNYKMGIQLNF